MNKYSHKAWDEKKICGNLLTKRVIVFREDFLMQTQVKEKKNEVTFVKKNPSTLSVSELPLAKEELPSGFERIGWLKYQSVRNENGGDDVLTYHTP